MKGAFVLLAGLLALARAFPGGARDSAESTEVEDEGRPALKHRGTMILLPMHHQAHHRLGSVFDDGDDDDGDDSASMPSLPGMWDPWNPFPDLFAKMHKTFQQVRDEMKAAFASHLEPGKLTPWGKIPAGTNTTSTTKIVGDHSVTVNETTYSDGDENGGTIIRVRVIDVKPLDNATTAAAAGNDESASASSASSETAEEDLGAPATTTRRLPTTGDDRREELSTTTTTQTTRSVETIEELDNEVYNKEANVKSQVETLSA